jgi:hypothetical protein
MIDRSIATLSIFITILLALLGLASAWVILTQKVKHNRDDIDFI